MYHAIRDAPVGAGAFRIEWLVIGAIPVVAGPGQVQGEPHVGERQYMEVLAVRSEAGAGASRTHERPGQTENIGAARSHIGGSL
jgi:hypothetical protein